MKVCIITTIFKAECDLPRLLDSMMAVKSPEVEFFLIDNGSPDRCGEICKEYAAKDSRFVVYSIKDNIGYIGARNQGLSVVDGDYVGFCDSDDFINPEGYDKAIQILKQYDCDLYIASWRTIQGEKIWMNRPPYEIGLYCGNQVKDVILPNAFGPINGRGKLHGFAWKQIYRREIATKFRFKEELKPYEDLIFNIDGIRECRSVFVGDTPIYNYIVNVDSITAKLTSNFDAEAEWKRINLLFEEKKNRGNEPIFIEASSNDYIANFYSMALNEVKHSRSLKLLGNLYHLNKKTIEYAVFNSSKKKSILNSVVCFALKHNLFALLSLSIKCGLIYKGRFTSK